jgi:hypothetical protein
VEEDAKVEAEAQALIQEQIDTTDVDGAFLRGLLVDITNEEDVALAEMREEDAKIEQARSVLVREMRGIHKQQTEASRDNPELLTELEENWNYKHKILAKLRERNIELKAQIEQKQEGYNLKRRSLFYVNPADKVEIELTVAGSKASGISGYMDTHINPQREFLESIWSVKGGKKKFEINVHGHSGGGGTSFSGQKMVEIGTTTIETTPLHEFTHQLEDQTHGARARRAIRAKEIILKYTGKQKIEEVELERHISYVDSDGKPHYGKKKVYVPKGIFKTPEEQAKYGYTFRVYSNDIMEKGYGRGKKYFITPRQTEQFGVEMPSTATEHIYRNPKKFAERFPEVFDMTVDLFRGKL